MAHVNLHLACGLATGAAITVVPLARAWLGGQPVATAIVRTVAASFALAIWASVPIGMTSVGFDAGVHHAWWANLFLGHAAIDARTDGGGKLIGELAVAGYLVGLYLLVLLALRRARRRPAG